MIDPIRNACFVLAATVLVAPMGAARAQTESAEPPDPEALLREVDARIYYPSRAGLRDFRFRWPLAGTGVFEELDGLAIAYAWKAPGKSRLDLVDSAGRSVADLPDVLETEAGKGLRAQLEREVEAMAQDLLVGKPLAEIYRDYHKTARRREVNRRIEYDLILHPKSKKRYASIVLKIVRGLPRRMIKTTPEGEEHHVYLLYEKRGDKWLRTGTKLEIGGQLLLEQKYSYASKNGVLVPVSMERGVSKGPPEQRRQTIKLEGLEVNVGLDDAFFDRRANTGDGGVK